MIVIVLRVAWLSIASQLEEGVDGEVVNLVHDLVGLDEITQSQLATGRGGLVPESTVRSQRPL